MRKVAVVGIGGVFPTCNNLNEFSEKYFRIRALFVNGMMQWRMVKKCALL